MPMKSKSKIPKDNRNKLWAKLEADIQSYTSKKDPKFRPAGQWKKFMRMEGKVKVYAVDGEWVRANMSIIFAHGGHGWGHEFIPKDEIWIATHHPPAGSMCNCRKVRKDRKASPAYFESTVQHELVERRFMKKGVPYWVAHNYALQKEAEVRLLPNPYTEIDF